MLEQSSKLRLSLPFVHPPGAVPGAPARSALSSSPHGTSSLSPGRIPSCHCWLPSHGLPAFPLPPCPAAFSIQLSTSPCKVTDLPGWSAAEVVHQAGRTSGCSSMGRCARCPGLHVRGPSARCLAREASEVNTRQLKALMEIFQIK